MTSACKEKAVTNPKKPIGHQWKKNPQTEVVDDKNRANAVIIVAKG
jgi:hypothetical protein